MSEIGAEFKKTLVEFLDSECTDFGVEYKIDYDSYEDEDYGFPQITVNISTNFYPERSTSETFQWVENRLEMEMGEDCWYHVKEWDWTVKYFWMKVAPELWGKK